MADLVITSSNVAVAETLRVNVVLLGEAVSAGDIIVYDSTDDDWVLASNATDALSGTGDSSNITMALSDGAAGQKITALPAGNNVDVGSVLSAGGVYVLSTGGAISPVADATTNDYMVILGYAVDSDTLFFDPVSTGVQVA